MKPNYPIRDGWKSAGFGYASDMVHVAANHDDAVNFMKYLAECGGLDCEVLIAGDIINFAALHGAPECLKALFADGAKSDYPLEYWLKKAEKPSYGPRASKFQAAA